MPPEVEVVDGLKKLIAERRKKHGLPPPVSKSIPGTGLALWETSDSSHPSEEPGGPARPAFSVSGTFGQATPFTRHGNQSWNSCLG
jgi:hypothetical protein